MGRRKIEIQPIIHERNRSVTFLKRKNGLFKKAYELGVLCSVDVAVIIFEQRPGHNVKLYQYCSGDVQDIVQRHMRFDGEKDTRGPPDFSGSATTKLDDPADADDDDQEDDEEIISSLGKRRGDGSKASADLALNIDVDYRRAPQQRPASSSSLPLSSDRHSHSPSNKKQRIAPMMPPSSSGRTPPDNIPGGFPYATSMRGTGASSYNANPPYYPPLSTQASFGGPAYESFGGSRSGSRNLPTSYGDFPLGSSSRPPPTHRTASSDPFGLLDSDEPRQIPTSNAGYGGIEWPVHNNSGGGGMRQNTGGSGDNTSPSSNNWMELMGGGGGGGGGRVATRGREGERPGSRGRVIETAATTPGYEVKKES